MARINTNNDREGQTNENNIQTDLLPISSSQLDVRLHCARPAHNSHKKETNISRVQRRMMEVDFREQRLTANLADQKYYIHVRHFGRRITAQMKKQ